MKKRTGSLAALFLVGLTTTALAQATTIIGPDGSLTNTIGPVSVTQTANANTIGVVQVGGNPTATISQSGFYNRAAVAQVGTVNTATITQSGTYNRACIAQFGPTNNAATAQNGALNNSLIFQTAGAPNGSLLGFVQNCLDGPDSATPVPDVGQVAAVRFTNTLFTQLDSDRWQTCTEAPPPMVVKGVAPQPQERCPKWSVFWLGSYGDGDWDDRVGGTGLSYKLYSVTGGVEYKVSQNFLVGIAGNFTRTDADLNRGLGGINNDTSQIGLMASYYYPNFFLDGVLTWGFHDHRIVRTVDGFTPSTASPKGDSFTAAARAGYLFDMGWGRLGPIAGVTYARTKVDAYTETGDPFVTQSVVAQSVDGLIGSVGGQLRVPYTFGQIRVDPYVNLTAERDFRAGDFRVVGTTFTLNNTAVSVPVLGVGGTFGKVAGGVNIYVTPQMSALISAESTFARSGHDDFAVTGGFKASF